MDHFDTPFSPSVASASSSTLIVTPHPHSKDDSPPTDTVPTRRPPGVPMTRMIPTRMSGKGFIEPHHSHLPRRAKHRSVSRHRPPSSIDTNKTEGGFESKEDYPRSGSRDAVERKPAPGPEVPPSPTSKVRHPGTGPLQPHISNLPRRRGHARRPHSIANQKEERLCLQEVGAGSRIFVGMSTSIWKGEPAGSSSDEDADEEEEAELKQRYAAIVRLVPSDANNDAEEELKQEKGLLRLSLPKSESVEAGCTQLTRRQLGLGCSFLHRLYSSPDETRPVLILSPSISVADAFALAVCFHTGAVPPTTHRPPSPAVPPLTPLSDDSSHSSLPPEDDYSSSIYQLITKLHDEELLVIDDEDGRRPGRGDLKPGPKGLRNEWRGLLRHEGIAQLNGAWKPLSA